jgi:hypothetical protein
VTKWQLTAEQLKKLLIVSQVTLNAPVLTHNDDEETQDEASTSTDYQRTEAPAKGCEHDKARSTK